MAAMTNPVLPGQRALPEFLPEFTAILTGNDYAAIATGNVAV
jgi:hypothetical protein